MTPEFATNAQPISFTARPEEDSGKRYVWIEASSEDVDLQGERVLHDALWSQRDYYLKKGNIDLDHLSKIGLRLNPPIHDYYAYEIGRPVDVGRKAGRIYVKGCLYRGNDHAERIWQGLTEWSPRMTLFASVSGPILRKEPRGGVPTITKCMWNNVALTQEAVNHGLRQPVSIEPIGPFAKALAFISHDVFAKALTAGYGTDAGALQGGGALRRESLHGAHVDPYERFKSHCSTKILKAGVVPNPDTMLGWAHECGFSGREAIKAVTRFCDDLGTDLHHRKEAA